MTIRQTSIDVYNEVKASGLLSKMRWAVYEWLFYNGPATAAEVDDGLGSKHTHKRLSELRRYGVVTELGERLCKISGRNVIEWDITNNLPIKQKEDKTNNRPTRKQLEEQIIELKEENQQLKETIEKYKEKIKQLIKNRK